MKVEVATLCGPALDWAVAVAEKLPIKLDPMGFGDSANGGYWLWKDTTIPTMYRFQQIGVGYSPSTLWDQAGSIIERERINLLCAFNGDVWIAEHRGRDVPRFLSGPTALSAAMRCYVEYKFGNEIDIPDSLTGELNATAC